MHTIMNRRHVLATVALPFAGCLDFPDSGNVAVSTHTKPTSTESPGAESERTAAEATDHVIPETRYALGDTHTYENWRLAVETVDLTTAFETDEGERYEMPADEQLLVARTTVRSESDERDGWAAGHFAAVASDGGDGTVVGRPTLVVEHSAFADRPEGGVRVDDLARVEHGQQFDAQGYQVDPGERVDVWLVVVVPRELDRQDVAVAFDGDFGDDAPFPVWWVASGTA